MDKSKVVGMVEAVFLKEASAYAAGGVFLVEVSCKGSAADEIEVVVDGDGALGVGIDVCAGLSKLVEAALYAEFGEEADFALTVMSAGVGSPLKLARQYRKILNIAADRGGDGLVDVLFKDGRKLTGVRLVGECVPETIEVEYEVKELLPGKKRKEIVVHREVIVLADIKAVSEHLAFK